MRWGWWLRCTDLDGQESEVLEGVTLLAEEANALLLV